jgi:hypothetical protein
VNLEAKMKWQNVWDGKEKECIQNVHGKCLWKRALGIPEGAERIILRLLRDFRFSRP